MDRRERKSGEQTGCQYIERGGGKRGERGGEVQGYDGCWARRERETEPLVALSKSFTPCYSCLSYATQTTSPLRVLVRSPKRRSGNARRTLVV